MTRNNSRHESIRQVADQNRLAAELLTSFGVRILHSQVLAIPATRGRRSSVDRPTEGNRPRRPSHLTVSYVFGCVLMSLVVGCTFSSAPTANPRVAETEEGHHHDHGHHPKSYTSALTQIKQARDEVKAAFDAGTPQACDDALHMLAEVLEVLPEVAAESDLPKEDWKIVKDHSKALFDQFMKIHDGFHGDGNQGASFDSVAEAINEAIEVLDSKVAATGEKAAPMTAEHDHAEHANHEGHNHDEHEGHEH